MYVSSNIFVVSTVICVAFGSGLCFKLYIESKRSFVIATVVSVILLYVFTYTLENSNYFYFVLTSLFNVVFIVGTIIGDVYLIRSQLKKQEDLQNTVNSLVEKVSKIQP